MVLTILMFQKRQWSIVKVFLGLSPSCKVTFRNVTFRLFFLLSSFFGRPGLAGMLQLVPFFLLLLFSCFFEMQDKLISLKSFAITGVEKHVLLKISYLFRSGSINFRRKQKNHLSYDVSPFGGRFVPDIFWAQM